MLGILWLIRYACSGFHFGNPAAQTAQAQQNQQQQSQNSAQQAQQQAMFNLQQYLAQNPNPFQNIGIQGPQTQQQMPQSIGGGMTTGMGANPLASMLHNNLAGTTPPQFGGGAHNSFPPNFGGGPQQPPGSFPPHLGGGLPPGINPPRLAGGGGTIMHTMPTAQQPPGAQGAAQAAQTNPYQGGFYANANMGPNFRKGSYGNLL